jgi:oligoendopeptidase F
MNAYWRAVVVDQPVYYISYGVSAVGAMSLYTAAMEDYEGAMAKYQMLCEEPLEEGFLATLRAAGLDTPFDEEFYQDLLALVTGK